MENTRELIMLVDAVAKEKGLPKDEILSYLAEGIEVSLRKNFPEGARLQVDIDPKTGEISAWRIYELVDQIQDLESQMLHSEVEDEEVLDGYAWEKFDPKLTRQQFNITKQVALQKLKSHSRDQVIQNMLDKPINLYSGIVKVLKKESIIVDCNGIDISISRRNLLPREIFKAGQKIRFTLDEENGVYFGTRVSPKFLIELFKEEVHPIEDGDIEIVSCARNPGMRAKVLVMSKNSKYDAARMCIGAKGVHIKNIQEEIPGEFIDIIEYEKDPVQLLIKSLEPVTVSKIMLDEETKTMEVAVDNNDIAQAIGKGGKNIELISNLIGWNIKVYSEDQWEQRKHNTDAGLIHYFAAALDCDSELAQYIIDCGLTSIEEIAYLSEKELELDELDTETIDALKSNAKETLANSEKVAQCNGLKELYELGFNEDEVHNLIDNKVFGNQDIADLSTYDLQDIIPDIDMEKAKTIIMKSRQLLEI